MLRRAVPHFAAAAGLTLATVASAHAQLSATADWATKAQNQYQVQANVTYLSASGVDVKLDVYRRRDVTTPQPTLVFYHGGGWIAGTKESSFMSIMPWLEMGWNVVNVEYRMARVAQAPAAAEDAQCALRYVVSQAKTYNVDTARIVLSGESAGGHLALLAGMAQPSAGFTSACAAGGFAGNDVAVPKVAGIINWYGITDVAEMLSGTNARSYAVQWVGATSGREPIARVVSPLTHVRADVPPVLSIQGDADPIVPYSQNVRFRDAMVKAGAKAELFTVPGGGHGNFNPEERVKIYAKIREFLAANGLAARPGTAQQ